MNNKLFCSLIAICLLLLSACGSTKLESGLKQIELGMTKQEVSSILGKKYTIMGSGTTPDGNMETWCYTDPNLLESNNKKIIVNFLDGRLDEWHREYIPTPPSVNNNNHD